MKMLKESTLSRLLYAGPGSWAANRTEAKRYERADESKPAEHALLRRLDKGISDHYEHPENAQNDFRGDPAQVEGLLGGEVNHLPGPPVVTAANAGAGCSGRGSRAGESVPGAPRSADDSSDPACFGSRHR